MTKVFISALFSAGLLFAQVAGLPTNCDEHGMPGMVSECMPSNVDRPTAKIAPPSHPRVASPRQALVPAVLPTPVLTRGYDLMRSGSNTHETVLTPENVGGLRKLFSHPLPGDDRLEAQPLIATSVKLADGETKALAVYATMSNNIFAYDATSPRLMWSVSLGMPIHGGREIDGWSINQSWGILSTPVIDPDTNVLYAVTWSSPDRTGNWRTAIHTLVAVSLADGHVLHSLSLEGATYDPGHGLPVQRFENSQRKQRASLALATVGGRKTVFIPFGTIQETSGSARGWVIAYDVQTNSIGATWVATARYSGGGIWAAGQAPAVRVNSDGTADLFFLTGNGSFDAVTDWGECFLNLRYRPMTSFTVVDWWSPFSDSGRAGGDQAATHITTNIRGGWDDMDLGSGGVVYIPEFNLLIGSGKDGIAYSLDASNMGKTQPGDFGNPAKNYAKAKWIGWYSYFNPAAATPARFSDLNTIYAGRTHHVHSTPVWFKDQNGDYKLYVWGENGNLRCWHVGRDGKLTYLANGAEVASVQSPVPPGGMPGGMLSLSMNGTQNAILWATVPLRDANKEISPGVLYAYDANHLGRYSDGAGAIKLLWTSPVYTFSKFDPPIVSGGRVYVPTYSGTVDVYGLN